jgi:hypothetical protein
MDYKFLLHRTKDIILNPVKAWEAIHSENRPLKDVRGSFFFPLIILVAISAFLGSLIFTHSSLSPLYSIFIGIKYFILLYILIYASSIIFKEITHALDLGKNFSLSFNIITYSLAPFFLCQIISHLLESLIFVNILALYGLYIFWTGAEKLLNPPEHKKMPLLIATSVVVIELYIAMNWILTSVIDRLYFAFFA